MKDAKNYLNKKLKKDDAIVIALSGGPDSMGLLNLLLSLKDKLNLTLIAAHVNHNVRKQSDDEQLFVKNYCHKNNVIFEAMKIKNYTNDNFHNEARLIRYDFFEKIISKYNAKYLMTAHHGDDLIETILMRICRGSTFKGYAGFKKEDKRGTYEILRPLINYSKKEIENYDRENDIPYVTDLSNLSDKYTRNRYRKEVVAFLKEEDANVHLKFLKYNETINEYNDYVESIIRRKTKKIFTNNILNIDEYLKLKPLEQRKTLEFVLDNIYDNDLALVTTAHINNIIKLINSNKTNAKINLPKNLVAKKTYSLLEFRDDNKKSVNYNIELETNVFLPNNKIIEVVNKCDWTNNNCIRLSSKEIVLPLYVRSRKTGDKIAVKNMVGTKKINDIFIDEKIVLEDRDIWPILIDSKGTILWLPGLKKSKFDKEKNEKYDIIIKYI